MEKLTVVGGTSLNGDITVGGAKNAILPVLAASLLTGEECIIHDVPPFKDVLMMLDILKHFGAMVNISKKTVTISCKDIAPHPAGENLMRQLRASNLIMGPLLARFGYFKAAYPGGCDIGLRPINYHIKGLEKLGAQITEKGGFIEAKSALLRGTTIHLDFPSVGTTENLMMSSIFIKGTSIIQGAAREPEIIDLQNFLNRIGAKVRGAGTDTIHIEGVSKLYGGEHTVIPDRIEAGTHMIAAAITSGNVVIKNVIPKHVESIVAKISETGAEVRFGRDEIYIKGPKRAKAKDIKTMPYPGFPTDMQPQFMVLMSTADGTSIISESIFEKRFAHIDELRRMGADIIAENKIAIIRGKNQLSGAYVEATDLRAGAALVIAALRADGITTISNISHIDRGYESIEKKYADLGANIYRTPGISIAAN